MGWGQEGDKLKIKNGRELISIVVLAIAAAYVVLLVGAITTPGNTTPGNTTPGNTTPENTAPGNTNEPSAQQLQDQIQQRDVIIRKLARRIDELDRRIGTAPLDPAGAKSEPESAEHTQVTAVDPDQPPQSVSQRAVARSPKREGNTSPTAPGQFEVSEDDAERALERTLTATGNLLVPSGVAEVEPQFSYTRREATSLVLYTQNRNEYSWALSTRLGLPWETQFELSLPYNLVQRQVTDSFVSPVQEVSNRWGNALGDVTIGVAKTFVHESGWIPDLLGRITYEIPTGPESNNRVVLPSRMENLSFSGTAVKRQDPLVFTATAGYTKAFRTGTLDPGDQIKFQLGAFLGTSPETTLRSVLQQSFFDDTRINNVRTPGSGGVSSVLNFGGSSIVYRNILVDLQVGVGLTDAAPKYSVMLSSTYRFGVPGI
jgi:hypothetical protein